ncbi:Hypothetical protein I595_2794 [Croceitalea dokdonensis DOKDO 023]|uniref:Uncharacterized protein n=1 Tax=Croceitalea dokdonensis DOKDO 023 TaxID=1300341 RepID=A0A0P7AF91_9FLAO|nr:Hypothetical protein I595_2794 [Croceitalea dokdonensis DOKDO 023]
MVFNPYLLPLHEVYSPYHQRWRIGLVPCEQIKKTTPARDVLQGLFRNFV